MRNSEFSLVKIGERSRMGLSQLFDTWKSEGYVQPVLKETYDPDRTWVEVEFESTEKRPESTERSTESSSESTEKSTDPRQRWCMGGLEEMRDGFVMERIRFVLGLCPILFVRHLLDGGGVVGCFCEICIILLFFAVGLMRKLGMRKGLTVASQLEWQLVKKFYKFKKGYTLCILLTGASEGASCEKPISGWPFSWSEGCAS